MSEIERYELLLREAMIASDVEALDRLISDDLIFTAFTGQLATKEDDLAMHRSGAIQIETLDILDRQVRFLGEAAIVVSHVRIAGNFNHSPASGEFRFTRVWHMRPEGWQIVVGSTTAVS